MSGCYGNSPEDQARARELDKYLDSLDMSPLDKKIEARQGEVYDDLEQFKAYMMHEYEGFFAIAYQLNRALCLSGVKDAVAYAGILDAVAEMKLALDAHIENTVRTTE